MNESLECFKYTTFITNLDIWSFGALCGGLLVVLARWLERYLDLKFMVNQKKLDVMFGEALLKIKLDLDDRILKLKNKSDSAEGNK